MSKDITNVKDNAIFQVKKVKVDDILINYAEAGKGRVIILVHGWNNNWKGQVLLGEFLAKKFRVLLIDLPGFGDSGRLPHYTLETQAKYLKEFIETLKIKKPIIAGHSMGAYVASKFYNLYPNTASRIVLLAPMFKKQNKEKLMKLSELFYRAVRKTRTTRRIIKRIVDSNIYTYITAKYVNMHKFDWKLIEKTGIEGKKKVSPEAYVDMGIEILTTNTDDLIRSNAIPIDLIFGKYDKLTNSNHAREILTGKGDYEISVIDNAGHILTVEKPKETARVFIKLIS